MTLQQCGLCKLPGTNLDKHHPSFRYFHRDTVILLCRKCHDFVHREVKWATENGYIIRDHLYEKQYHEQ